MTDQTCPHNALVVVTSGAEAKMFRNTGTPSEIKLTVEGSLTPENLLDDGPSGKRPVESSERSTDEATFAKQLAHHLYQEGHKGKFDHLVLVADPTTLGEIRPILHLKVTDKMTMELDKTLINSPIADIERSLAKAAD